MPGILLDRSRPAYQSADADDGSEASFNVCKGRRVRRNYLCRARPGNAQSDSESAVARIEKNLSTRLLERSSRKIRLTESGIILFEHCRRIAEEIGRAEAAVGSLEGVARGKLRIAAPFTFGHFLLSPILPDFLIEHPEVQTELEVTNRRVDPIEEAFDLVVRVGAIEDSTMVAKNHRRCGIRPVCEREIPKK